MFAKLLLIAIAAGAALLPQRAVAMPVFAQRYHLTCGACHSFLPELNTFGNAFRQRGYRLPIPKHGTTGIALRYQLEDDRNPAPGARPIVPGGVLATRAGRPEFGAFVRTPVTPWLAVSGAALAGAREIFPQDRATFTDGYRRLALGADAHAAR